MSEQEKDVLRLSSAGDESPAGENYEVGYGKPPMGSRFKPGQSGNKKGRPKASKNLRTLLEEELRGAVEIREGGKKKRVSKLEAIIKRMTNNALKGGDRSIEKTLDLYLRVVGLREEAEVVGTPLTDDECEIINGLEARLRRRIETQSNERPKDPPKEQIDE